MNVQPPKPYVGCLNAHTMHVFKVLHEAAQQDRLFIEQVTKGMSPEQLARFKLENGYV